MPIIRQPPSRSQSFSQAMAIQQGDVVCIIGAGGKTSLMFRLAEEAKLYGYKVLVTTTTRLMVPTPNQYDAIDLSGKLFSKKTVTAPGIYVGGKIGPEQGKMTASCMQHLTKQQSRFDLVLIEADGAAKKPLKGWKKNEPVIPLFTTKTIGVIDIQTIGQCIKEALVHRLNIFLEITGTSPGEPFSMSHLLRLISHENGLFHQMQGERLLYINKVESARDRDNARRLKQLLHNQKVVAGSVRHGAVYV